MHHGAQLSSLMEICAHVILSHYEADLHEKCSYFFLEIWYDLENITKITPSVLNDQVDTAMMEAKKIYQLEKSFGKSSKSVDGVRVFSLSKTYRSKD